MVGPYALPMLLIIGGQDDVICVFITLRQRKGVVQAALPRAREPSANTLCTQAHFFSIRANVPPQAAHILIGSPFAPVAHHTPAWKWEHQ